LTLFEIFRLISEISGAILANNFNFWPDEKDVPDEKDENSYRA
jgi:hypothetical protein